MQPSGSTSAWSRLAPWAGIAFAVLFVAGFFIHGVTPEGDEVDEWQTYWDDSGHRTQAIIGAYLMIAGLFAFLWFARDLLGRVGGSQLLSSIAQGASTLFVGILLIGVLIATAIAGSVEFGDAPVPEGADLAIQLDQLAFGLLLLPGCLSAAVFIGVVSELARRSDALPTWLVWAGYVVAALQLLSVLFIPLALIPLWAVVTAIVLLLRSRSAEAPAAAAPTAA